MVEANINREKANINREKTINLNATAALNYFNLPIEQYNLLDGLNEVKGL